MRTSRISRETAQVVNAMASRSSMPQRRSLRQYQHAPEVSAAEVTVKKEQIRDESSELSSAPGSPIDNLRTPSLDSTATTASRKRKRGTETPATSASLPSTAEPIRRSPRKSGADDTSFPRKARRQPAKRIKGENGNVKVEPPANWEEIYATTAEMRKRVLAPVDTMGCESLAEDHRSPRDRRLQTLVALMLSSQTKDTVTAVAMKNLQQGLPGGFCLDSLLVVEPDVLNGLIEKVGFHNNKTKFIKATAEILRDKFGGDIPDTIEGLVSLPGVGPKMAYLTMSAAWGRDEGIGVDVHVHRITNLWGWHKTKNPEETRAELESWLPREKWHDINHLLVGFGQTICLPVGRKCGGCTLAEKGLCPSAVVTKEVKKRVKKETVVKNEDGQELVKQEVKDEVVVKLEKADESAPPLDLSVQANGGAEPALDIEDIGAATRTLA